MTMCKRLLTVAAGALTLGAGTASAQYQPPRPAVSPYINLLRRGDAAINYYGIVRPIQDQQQINQTFADQQNQLRQQVLQQQPPEETSGGEPIYPTTGHPTGVLSYNRFFLNRGTAGATFAPAAGGFGTGGFGAGGMGTRALSVPSGGSRSSAPVRTGVGVPTTFGRPR